MAMYRLGLRIDVDTYRGTRLGVPALCRALTEAKAGGTFYFSLGPDNMGRHLFRLLRPQFLLKMLRSRAASLYGWDILFKGTLGPGPRIGRKLEQVIRDVEAGGFEVGLHAWDHHAWQAKIDNMTDAKIYDHLRLGVEEFTRIFGHSPASSAAPGWKCTEAVLEQKARFDFRYNSDCRGDSSFNPVVGGKALGQPQIPVTLPTYDEIIGQEKITDETFNDYILSLLEHDKLNVLTIHAEVEGIAKNALFKRFLAKCGENNVQVCALKELVDDAAELQRGTIVAGKISGREGWVCRQVDEVN